MCKDAANAHTVYAGACSSHVAETHCGYWQEKKKPKLGTHLLVKKKNSFMSKKHLRNFTCFRSMQKFHKDKIHRPNWPNH